MKTPSPEEIFPAIGKPNYTYVEREEGVYENRLASGLKNPGQICLLTGPSKTGKTSLYRQVLPKIKKTELVIRCSGSVTPTDFWASALESLDFKRIAETSNAWGLNLTGKIGIQGEAGWSWLAKALATIGFDISTSGEYSVKKEVINSRISSKHLIPLLKELPIQLVVEDFHYLEEETKKEVFQQWKSFIDEGVSVLVVSTTHHAVDIARANPDLSGRARLIDMGKWDVKDLAQIPSTGFKILGIKHTPQTANQIARESVGLPIITQQICQEIASKRDMTPGSRYRAMNVQVSEIESAQKYVAENLYGNHKGDYDQLIAGPRQRRRKHATYEKILASFALEPLQFSLNYGDLISRVNSLCATGESIPSGSITSALKALANFQMKRNMALLDWHDSEKTLYIVEPSFLFYLRQKLENQSNGGDLRQTLVQFFEIIEKKGGLFEIKMLTGSNDPENEITIA